MNDYRPYRPQYTPEPCQYCGRTPLIEHARLGHYGTVICEDCAAYLICCVNCGQESMSPALEFCLDCENPFYRKPTLYDEHRQLTNRRICLIMRKYSNNEYIKFTESDARALRSIERKIDEIEEQLYPNIGRLPNT